MQGKRDRQKLPRGVPPSPAGISPGSRITFDGVDIINLWRYAVLASVAVVPQHPFFLKNTDLRGNLIPHRQQGEMNSCKTTNEFTRPCTN